MLIEQRIVYMWKVYMWKGRQYNKLEELQTAVEDRISAILATMRMDPKTALAVFDAIVRHKEELVGLLSLEVEKEGEDVNILDLEHSGP